MTAPNYKRLTIVLGVVCLVLLIFLGRICWEHGLLSVRVKYANEQIKIFEDMTTQALKDGVPDAALCLDYVVNYYPSGTKQKTGSELDQIVERARKNAEDDIIAYLRKNAAEDLGNNSEPWIKKFGLK